MLGIPSRKLLLWVRHCGEASLLAWAGFYFFLPNQTLLSSIIKTVLFYGGLFIVGFCVLWYIHRGVISSESANKQDT